MDPFILFYGDRQDVEDRKAMSLKTRTILQANNTVQVPLVKYATSEASILIKHTR